LTITLERIAQGWPNKRIDELLPWNFKDSLWGALDAYVHPKAPILCLQTYAIQEHKKNGLLG
jgi:hypothetical protein